MGKFDGILLCTDLDDTLLTTDKRVSDENSKAIEYSSQRADFSHLQRDVCRKAQS